MNFIERIVSKYCDSEQGPIAQFRFPPEPNGYLHLGHAKSIALNFNLADMYGDGKRILRFDDTNPAVEDQKFEVQMLKDLEWLGYSDLEVRRASDYFDRILTVAYHLIDQGLAYACFVPADVFNTEYLGTIKTPGKASPSRDLNAESTRAHLHQMLQGGYPEGFCVIRAKIDMASKNMKMRDPVIFRVKLTHPHGQKRRWRYNAYPTYDFAHPLSDLIEGTTHSLCTLEFDNNRELYDWYIKHAGSAVSARREVPHQIEFAKLNVEGMTLSKRNIKQAVADGRVSGWDDPALPTLAGLRNRGVPARAVHNFMERIGVRKADTLVPQAIWNEEVRKELRHSVMGIGIFDPVEVTFNSTSCFFSSSDVHYIDPCHTHHTVLHLRTSLQGDPLVSMPAAKITPETRNKPKVIYGLLTNTSFRLDFRIYGNYENGIASYEDMPGYVDRATLFALLSGQVVQLITKGFFKLYNNRVIRILPLRVH